MRLPTLICIILFVHGHLLAQLQWETVYPTTDSYVKNAICSPAAGVFIIVGSEGRIWRSVDDGMNWEIVSSGTIAALYDVAFAGPLAGCIVGAGGIILRTTDGGTSWESFPSGTSAHLHSLVYVNMEKVIAAGDNGTVRRTLDGGRSWHRVMGAGSENLHGIAFATASLGAAVGDDGTLAITTNGGSAWYKHELDSLMYPELRIVEALSDSSVLIVSRMEVCTVQLDPANAGAYRRSLRRNYLDQHFLGSTISTNGSVILAGYGQSWCQTPPSPACGMLSERATDGSRRRSHTFYPSQSSYLPFNPPLLDIAQGSNGTNIAISENGIILRGDSLWETWTSSNPATADLRGLAAKGDSALIAFDRLAVNLESRDGGNTWQSNAELFTSDISFMDADTGLKVIGYYTGRRSYLRRTTNGGGAWTIPLLNYFFVTAAMHSSGFCLALDSWQAVHTSTNGGRDWKESPSDVGLNFASPTILIVDSRKAYLIERDALMGVGALYETNDQGKTWQKSDAPLLDARAYVFSDSVLGVAVHTNLWLTHDAGVTWQNQGSTPFPANGVHLRDSTFILIVGDKGQSAGSRDLGKTWAVYEPVTMKDLFACHILRENQCVAVGGLGTVLHGTLQNLTSVEAWTTEAKTIQVHPNRPNPFNSSTAVSFTLARQSHCRLTVYDSRGREVAVLQEGKLDAGTYNRRFTTGDLPSGLYIAVLQAGAAVHRRKMLLVQ